MSAAVGWELPSRDHHFLRDIQQLLATHRDLLSSENATNHSTHGPLPAEIPPTVPTDPWTIGLQGDAGTITGNEPFQFSWATTPTSASNSPVNKDPAFFWTGPTAPYVIFFLRHTSLN